MPIFTDEQLVAYADGELSAAEADAIAAAAKADAVLAQRIARFADSRRVLHEAFAAQLRAPVPQRLLDLVRGEPAARGALPQVRTRTQWLPLALAASLALAVGASGGIWLGAPQAPPTVAGLPTDADALVQALETRASGEAVRTAQFEIMPTATMRTAHRTYCREFESAVYAEDKTTRARGLACRERDGGWQTVAVAGIWSAPDAAAAEGYVPAGGSAAGFGATLGGLDRLTPQQEAELIERGWTE